MLRPFNLPMPPTLTLLTSPAWTDYTLLDTGHGKKLEQFGPHTFVRPEAQAIWRPTLPEKHWRAAHGEYVATGDEGHGKWELTKPLAPWNLHYKGLGMEVQVSGSRHLGVFPEQATHWDWMRETIAGAKRPVRVLNLFGYTGLASLAAAQAGASVTHVDASKKAVAWGQKNQELSNLKDRPIRWLVDDVEKFVRREIRRGSKYDGLILDPPKFGRGPSGEVWEFFEAMTDLLANCKTLLSASPLFIILTAYAIRASALSIHYAMEEMVKDLGGTLTSGELTLQEQSAGRLLSMAIFARWRA
ncbi:MAG: class I SAM-dependent rRNA methyltransferase [Anaerolineales bacterium]